MPSRYLLRRLAQVLPTVAGLLALNFCIIHLAPGDPVIALGGEHGDAAPRLIDDDLDDPHEPPPTVMVNLMEPPARAS